MSVTEDRRIALLEAAHRYRGRDVMRPELARTETRLVRWIVGSGVAMVGTLAGLGGLLLALH